MVLAALGCIAFAAVVQLTPSGEGVAPAQIPDAAAAASSQASSPIRIPFPPTIRRVWLNIGSHIDPPVSPNEDTMTIAVEPVLSIAANITKHPRLLVLPCAISDRVGIAPFYAYNDGLSSSLNLANEAAPDLMGWKSKALPSDIPSVALVPVVTLRHLLDAIPRHIEIELIKTDMQGHDLAAIKSAGLAARRAKFIHHEASCDNKTSYAGAPQNDAELDWIAYMINTLRVYRPIFLHGNIICLATGETELDWVRVANYDPDSDPELAAEEAVREALAAGAGAEAATAAAAAASAAASARRASSPAAEETVAQRVSTGKPFGPATQPLEPAVWAETIAAAEANASLSQAANADGSSSTSGSDSTGSVGSEGGRVVVAPSGVAPLTISFDVRNCALPPASLVPNRVDSLLGELILGLRTRDPAIDPANLGAPVGSGSVGAGAEVEEAGKIFWARYPAVRVLNFIEFQGAGSSGVLGTRHVYVPAEMAADTDLAFLIKGAWIW